MRHRLASVAGALAVLVLVTLAVLVGGAAPAAAHAELEETDPGNGSGLETSPDRVTLRFSEAVTVSSGSVQVFDGNGSRVEHDRPEHPSARANEVEVALPELTDGPYVVTWRVVSSDSHPVQGAFTFLVGNAAPAGDDLSARLLAGRTGSSVVGAIYAVDRAAAFAALLVLVGGGLFVSLLWPAGARTRSFRRLAKTAWVVLIVTTALAVGLQGGYAGGLGLAESFSVGVYRDVLGTRFGRVYAARIGLLALGLPLLLRLFGERHYRPRWWAPAAAGLGIGLVATPGLAGHATSGVLVPLAVPADVLHVGSAAAWIGGLVVLVCCVLPRVRGPELERAVTGFSGLAAGSVAVLVATGVFQGWRQAGSLSALTSTSYGRLLIAKTALVAVILAVAAFSRSAVLRRWGPPTPVGATVDRMTERQQTFLPDALGRAASAPERPAQVDQPGADEPGPELWAPTRRVMAAPSRFGRGERPGSSAEPSRTRVLATPSRFSRLARSGASPTWMTGPRWDRERDREQDGNGDGDPRSSGSAVAAGRRPAGEIEPFAPTRADRDAVTVRRLRRTVGAEATVAAAVLALTSLLVNAPPARNVAAEPSSGTLTGQTLLLDYTVDPARTGPNTIHLYALTRGGQQQNVVEMTMTLSLPAKGIASLPVPLQKAGPGHFQSLGFVVPIQGTWQVQARARTSEIDADTFFGSVKIG